MGNFVIATPGELRERKDQVMGYRFKTPPNRPAPAAAKRRKLAVLVLLSGILFIALIVGLVVLASQGRLSPEVVKALGPACSGKPVPGAAGLTGSAPRRIIVLDGSGDFMDHDLSGWTNKVADWRATTVENAALVACVDRKNVFVDTCDYSSTGNPGGTVESTLRRYKDHAHVRVMATRTGEQVEVFDLDAEPPDCPAAIGTNSSRADLVGQLTFATLSTKLAELSK